MEKEKHRKEGPDKISSTFDKIMSFIIDNDIIMPIQIQGLEKWLQTDNLPLLELVLDVNIENHAFIRKLQEEVEISIVHLEKLAKIYEAIFRKTQHPYIIERAIACLEYAEQLDGVFELARRKKIENLLALLKRT